VLGDVGEPKSVGSLRRERPADQVVVDGRADLEPPTALAGEHGEDAVGAAQTLDAVLARGESALRTELVGDEPVAEGRIVGVDVASRVDEVGTGPVPVRAGAARHL
jgi:hypothetical protein